MFTANYNGHSKVERLLCISNHFPLSRNEALRLAVQELRWATQDTSLYLELASRAELAVDMQWVESVRESAEENKSALEHELAAAKANLAKESIRNSHLALGDFYSASGDYQQAAKHYMKTRDYCTTPKQILEMCVKVLESSLVYNRLMHVPNYVLRAESTPELADDTVAAGKIAIAAGVASLSSGNFSVAAKKLTSVPADLVTYGWKGVLAPTDIALYGALTALAGLDRHQLRSCVIENAGFKPFLDTMPALREAVYDFYSSRYTPCMEAVSRMHSTLAADPFLFQHVDTIISSIRRKAMKSYVAPFSTLDMRMMAEAFGTDLPGIEKELIALIQSKDVEAKIDSHNKVLYATKKDSRSAMCKGVVEAAREHLRDGRALLIRACMMQHDMVQRGGAPERPEREEGRVRSRNERLPMPSFT